MVVIITGATSAWGKVAAGTYALGGANLVLVDTDASQLDALAGSATKGEFIPLCVNLCGNLIFVSVTLFSRRCC